MQTFSVGFDDAQFDELQIARVTARRYGTDHHEIVLRHYDMSCFADLVNHFDEPLADVSMLTTYCIAREAGKFVKVRMSGNAGDEVFGGYLHYREALRYARFDWIRLPLRRVVLGAIAGMMPDSMPGKGFLRRFSATPASRYQRQIGKFDVFERRALLNLDIARETCSDARLFEPYFAGNHRDVVTTCQEVDFNTYLAEDILVKVDRAAMKCSLEVRIPFLDHRLVELVNSMPVDLKIRGSVQKYPLRKVLEDVVPSEVIAGPKRGFGLPIKSWFRDHLEQFPRDFLLGSDSRNSRYLQRKSVELLLSNHHRGGRDLSDRIWSLLVLEQWLFIPGCERF